MDKIEEREIDERYRLDRDDRPKKKKGILAKFLIIFSLVAALAVGFLGGYALGSGRMMTIDIDYDQKSQMIRNYMEKYWLYGDEYEDLDEVLSDNSYYGMTTFPNDPYTTYQSADELAEFSSSINMDFVGVGVSYTMQNGIPTIIKVYNDSPAAKAGLMAGDIIEKIDGVNIKDKTTEEIKSMVLGEEGTVVNFEITRQNDSLSIDVTRGHVDTTVYGYEMDGIPVLELVSFGTSTYDECVKFLSEYQNSDKLIIDLRNNTGGYQTAVLDIAGLFLPDGSVVMRAIYKDGREEVSYETSDIYFDNFQEIAILTNGETASASEVLAMALKEGHANAYTVGDTSFGKGVMQSTFQLPDGSALKITTAKWLSPNNKWINDVGIVPDHPVAMHPALYETFYYMDENDSYQLSSSSEYVRVCALALDYLGYKVERTDGYFDESFEAALNAYKQDNGFEPDGILDVKTYEGILSSITKTNAIDKSKDVQLNEAIKLITE